MLTKPNTPEREIEVDEMLSRVRSRLISSDCDSVAITCDLETKCSIVGSKIETIGKSNPIKTAKQDPLDAAAKEPT